MSRTRRRLTFNAAAKACPVCKLPASMQQGTLDPERPDYLCANGHSWAEGTPYVKPALRLMD
jgi:hypothetical protein